MEIMLIGFVIFMGIHILPNFPEIKDGFIQKLGKGGYKGLFALCSLGSIMLIVTGKGQVENIQLWTSPEWGEPLILSAMPFALFLLISAYMPSNVKRIIRHPMLWSVVLWSVSHLIVSGDLPSTILFLGFALVSLIMMVLINRRNPKPKTVKVPWFRDVIVLVIAAFLYQTILYSHQYFTGISIT